MSCGEKFNSSWQANMVASAVIKKLEIIGFRGIDRLEWRPSPGMNMILGGGDVGKTTVLEAIALLLSPTNSATLSESDFHERGEEFSIEATVALSEDTDVNNQKTLNWPWHWDGRNAVQPPQAQDDDLAPAAEPVYRLRVRGTGELELVWEIIQPHEQTDHLSVALRRKIGILRLTAEDRNDRDLRLVFGSALDRLFSDTTLRGRISKQVAGLDLNKTVGEESGEKLSKLDERLEGAALPHGLSLGLTTAQGLSIGALIGLLARKNGVRLPLSTWGAGTRRMTALAIAAESQTEGSIITIDELERGLEPYRLRRLIREICADSGQSFVTTHSPVAIACAEEADLWYLDTVHTIGALPRNKIAAQQRRDPETFLARVAVIGEGPTEVGFLLYLLEKAFTTNPLDHGVRVCDGQGNDAFLQLLEALAATGLRFAGLADNEGRATGRWAQLKVFLGDRLLQWHEGCTEQVIIEALRDEQIPHLMMNEEGHYSGVRLRTLSIRLGIQGRSLEEIEVAAEARGTTLKALVIQAASGSSAGAPEGDEKAWKAHGTTWFKSLEGGRELARKMAELDVWPTIQPRLLPLINAVLAAAQRPAIEALNLE